MENTNDTNIEEELQVEEQEASTTDDSTQEETVENFSEELDKAETEEEALDAFKNISDIEQEEPETNEDADDEELDTKAEAVTSNSFTIKDGDIEFDLNPDVEEERRQLTRLAQQGLNYAGKTTELAKHKSFVQYAEENGITLEDIQQMALAKGGNKDAISNIAKGANVDVFDLDNDMADDYKPEPVQVPQQADPMLDTIANEILADESAKESFQKWFPTMPQDIQEQVMGNSQVLRGVQEDINSGVFDKAMDQAYKYQRVDGMDFGSAYTRAKNEVRTIMGETPSSPPVSRGERVRASSSRPTASTQVNRNGYAEGVISDMNDEDFMSNYRDIVASVQANR